MSIKNKLEFESLFNFRTVVSGKLYRSADIDKASPRDVNRLKSLGIKTIIDLRWMRSRDDHAPMLLDNECQLVEVNVQSRNHRPPVLQFTAKGQGVNNHGRHYFVNVLNRQYYKEVLQKMPWYRIIYIVLSIIVSLCIDVVRRSGHKHLKEAVRTGVLGLGSKQDQGRLQWYKDMVDFSSGPIFAALKLASDPQNQPAVICCEFGKDRTGIIVALLLAMLGRSKEDIIEDCDKSEINLKQMFPEDAWFCTKPMLHLLDYINQKYGSVDSYLLSIGFTKDGLANMRSNLQ